MGLFDRMRGRTNRGRRSRGPGRRRSAAGSADLTNPDFEEHLATFCRTRFGIEAWVEEASAYARPSLLLVAHDGEWTRRQVPDEAWAYRWAERQQIPARRAGVIPYPQRMRDWNARQRARTRRDQAASDRADR